ncbi:hypothetical protein FTUN_1191 [Frigoriglobus tundricola]|uniref:Uncharacterized protein n=1 Tax=Frigoriglobus tundricola TaxID=2774151 RepID=A0A6M5YK77_9BACT|nr:hypothetical protein FTUN_1191 [Frigoriglobus tundricola]
MGEMNRTTIKTGEDRLYSAEPYFKFRAPLAAKSARSGQSGASGVGLVRIFRTCLNTETG